MPVIEDTIESRFNNAAELSELATEQMDFAHALAREWHSLGFKASRESLEFLIRIGAEAETALKLLEASQEVRTSAFADRRSLKKDAES